MIRVHLYGSLRPLAILYAPNGAYFELHARDTFKACRLLAAQIPEFDRAMRTGYFRVSTGSQWGRKRDLSEAELRLPFRESEDLHITPRGLAAMGPGGGKSRSLGKLVMGVALIGVGLTGGWMAAPGAAAAGAGGGLGAGLGATAVEALGMTWGQIALAGASLALTSAASLLAGNPSISRYEQMEAPENRPNWWFTGGINSTEEGAALPWIGGKEVYVGTVVLAGGIIDEQVLPPPPPADVNGIIADFDGEADGEVIPA